MFVYVSLNGTHNEVRTRTPVSGLINDKINLLEHSNRNADSYYLNLDARFFRHNISFIIKFKRIGNKMFKYNTIVLLYQRLWRPVRIRAPDQEGLRERPTGAFPRIEVRRRHHPTKPPAL
jgi:hypothetical protein